MIELKKGEFYNSQAKAVMNFCKSGAEYGDSCVNHVEGCSHGCLYPCPYKVKFDKGGGRLYNIIKVYNLNEKG